MSGAWLRCGATRLGRRTRRTILGRPRQEPLATPSIPELPEHDRPRERLWALGAEALSDRELLALVIGSGRNGRSALDLAAALVEFGGMAGLAAARPQELTRIPGIGRAKAAAVVGALRLGRLGARDRETSAPIRGPQDIARAMPLLADARTEQVVVLVCNARHRVIHVERVSLGSVDRTVVPVREILNVVLRHDGRAFAVAHNHPSGDPTPSAADLATTADLQAAADAVGLRFLDHVVVAADRWERCATPTASPRTLR